ncbi:MAG: ribonuclease J [Ardenticatenaceae bacterium]|nr:ribonuclease J [Ardenticatenaceae bacterium]MCB9444538.1 ribonuclease J [Ardenticatenaceae bacterium]
MSKHLRIIPLGGLGEIGKNMTVLEYGRNQIIVDCGVMFPENDMYGIDLVLPNFDYVIENQETLRGIVLTHGHMDHIGGLPYLMKHVQTTIYGTPLTLGMAERQMAEANVLQNAQLQTVGDKETIHMGPFRVHLFPVAHSIPGSVGLVIDTPAGTVVHTGDYKLDETPAGGRTTDLKRLKHLTQKGVLALLADSTNADRPGRTPTEQVVADTLDELFAQANGRIIIATFSSVLARLQAIMDLAVKHGRKVALTGRSLQENVALARELGYMKVADKVLVDINARIADDKLIILSTGSQGEPRSALNRMAKGEHKQIDIHQGDTIIISGGTIPGNEEDVGRMLNKLFDRGANVIYGPLATVHVSGHGSRDEMRLMLETVKPRYFIPVHGESRHQHLHARIAADTGLAADHTFILQNGAIWASDGERAWLDESIPAEDVYVDGRLVGAIGETVMRDRQRLSQDGFIVVYVPVNGRSKLAGEPQIISRGFVHMQESSDLIELARKELKRQLQRKGRQNDPKETVRNTLQNFFYRETQSRPVILPNIVRI